MNEIEITEHAYTRAKERFSLNDKALLRLAAKALEHGFRYKQFKGKVKNYFNHLYLNNPRCNNIRIYGEIVYLFSKKRLVTLYKIPKPIINQIERCLIIPE